MKKYRKIIIDWWRERYAYAIPTLLTSIYIVISVYYDINLTQSNHISEALAGIVTAASILTGLLSALLGTIVQNKESSSSIKYFFENTDKSRFARLLKHSILSGFACIFLSCILFFSDVFGAIVALWISFVWLWILLYYLASTYRFVNIFVSLLIREKEPTEKKERDAGPTANETNLKKRIRESKK